MIVNHKEKLSFYHLNISSLPYHFQELNDLLNSLKKIFSTIGITDSWLKVNSEPQINIDLNSYNIESTPTESEKGGKFPSDLNYKLWNDLKIYKARKLEWVFIGTTESCLKVNLEPLINIDLNN